MSKSNDRGLYAVADLWSGKIHRTLILLRGTVEGLQTRLFRMENIMTQNEQIIVDAAQTIKGLTATFQQNFDALKAKIDTLTDQAASQQAHPPEDVTDEVNQLSEALSGMKQLSDSLSAGSEVSAPVDVAVPDDNPQVHPNDPPPPGSTITDPQTTTGDPVVSEDPEMDPEDDDDLEDEDGNIMEPEEDEDADPDPDADPGALGDDAPPAPVEEFPAPSIDPVDNAPNPNGEPTDVPSNPVVPGDDGPVLDQPGSGAIDGDDTIPTTAPVTPETQPTGNSDFQ